MVRVSGSLVQVEGLSGVAMFDVVGLGELGLPGEIVAITDGLVTVQAYEETGGLHPGAPVAGQGAPLSARLGPGLLGGIFDGMLRPLSGAGTWLMPAADRRDGSDRLWEFDPTVAQGAEVAPGDELGSVRDGPLRLGVLVPPALSGKVDTLVPAGSYGADTVVATVAGVEIGLTTSWPVRRPKPYLERVDDVTGLHTGQRVLDLESFQKKYCLLNWQRLVFSRVWYLNRRHLGSFHAT